MAETHTHTHLTSLPLAFEGAQQEVTHIFVGPKTIGQRAVTCVQGLCLLMAVTVSLPLELLSRSLQELKRLH